jgi:tetratricopeptide (TPR) repeat protein
MSTEQQNDPANQPLPRKSRRTTVLVVLAAVALVVLPLVFSEGRREISRWHQADAREKELDGDLNGAVESMDTAIQWNDAVEVYLTRARLKLDRKDFQGCLDDCETAIQETQAGPVRVAIWAHELRSQAYLEMGQHDKAVEDRKTIGELLKNDSGLMQRSSHLNSLAYHRALGGLELEEAAEDATKAVELLGDDDQLTEAMLRAALSSDWVAASPVYNEVAGYLKKQLSLQSEQTKQQIYDEIIETFPPSSRSSTQMSTLAGEHLDSFEQLWLLEQRQTHSIAAASDDDEASPNDALRTAIDELPTLERARETLIEFGQILDTRGFVFYKLALSGEADKRVQRLESARKDLDRAVAAIEVFVQSERTLLSRYPHRVVDPRVGKVSLKQNDRTIAVIRYHRALVLEALGEEPLAASDIARVKKLGHEPNEQLH